MDGLIRTLAARSRPTSTLKRKRVAAAAVCVLLSVCVSACGASVAGSNSAGIWFNEPFIGGWDEAEVAAQHCASFGKTAVLRGELLTNSRYTTPVIAYDCR